LQMVIIKTTWGWWDDWGGEIFFKKKIVWNDWEMKKRSFFFFLSGQ